ncbi:hypothetical protein A0H81_06323 [Grifola frondosa]|uniref:BTB domain-containing protein n=1 Tax=Grifola frondosa TaxID=5627 RepID=A0A1C7MBE7_GRIFR|nr:hypothetical protein A0H81_06323 [Grifola frondosa]
MEATFSSPTPATAPFPFNKPIADVILRSYDHIDFYVRSAILAEASPIFETMFTLPQPTTDSQDSKDGRAVIVVAEDSRTLECLLRLCYPITDPAITKLEEVVAVLSAAIKYEMEEAAALMKKELLSFAPRCPLKIWAIACRMELEAVARSAATHLLGKSLDLSMEDMEGISAGAYYRLRQFHRKDGHVETNFTFCRPPEPMQAENTETPPSTDCFMQPFSDIICRSSDGRDFPAHKVILSMASSVLRAKLAAPAEHGTDPSETDDGGSTERCMTLDFDEDSRTLAELLRLCYPGEETPTEHIPTVIAILKGAHKYGMDRHISLVERQWTKIASAEPLRAYFVAQQFDLHQCASDAAKRVLAIPIEESYVREMETSSAYAYIRLLKYSKTYKDAIQTAIGSERSLRCFLESMTDN